MKKYIVLYHAPRTAMQAMQDATPEDMQAGMEQWMAWAQRCGDGLVDMGTPLGGGQKISASGSSSPTDVLVAGYSILQAADMEATKALIAGHPHLAWDAGCEIEIHESLPLPG